MKIEVREICNQIDELIGLDPNGKYRIAVSFDKNDVVGDTIGRVAGWSLVEMSEDGEIFPKANYESLREVFVNAMNDVRKFK